MLYPLGRLIKSIFMFLVSGLNEGAEAFNKERKEKKQRKNTGLLPLTTTVKRRSFREFAKGLRPYQHFFDFSEMFKMTIIAAIVGAAIINPIMALTLLSGSPLRTQVAFIIAGLVSAPIAFVALYFIRGFLPKLILFTVVNYVIGLLLVSTVIRLIPQMASLPH
jgi:hypothetical protein